MDLKDFNRKQIILLVTLLLIVIAIPVTLYLSQKTQIFKPRAQETSQLSQNQPGAPADSHKDFFYAILELDPKTNSVTQLKTGKNQGGDVIPLLQKAPTKYPINLTYKLEVTSKKDVVLESGWMIFPKAILRTYQNNLVFTVMTLYQPEAIIRLYLPNNKLVWTGIMP